MTTRKLLYVSILEKNIEISSCYFGRELGFENYVDFFDT